MNESYSVSSQAATPFSVPEEARGRWEVYPAYGLDDDGACRCRKGAACEWPGKHPATRHGIKDASSDPLLIAEMFARNPGCNPGLATGARSRVVVLDWDGVGCGGAHRRLRELAGPLPDTRTHRSGSGSLHDFFAMPAGLDRLPSVDLVEGCELKADGTGVLLPPSRTNHGPYEILSDAPLAELPERIVEMATSLTVIEGGGERGTESRFVLPERIYESSPSRNRTLYEYGCSLRAYGWGHAAIHEELVRVNAERCVPPMDDDEVRKISASAARHEAGNASRVEPAVLAAVALLGEKARTRPKSGLGALSRWAVYRALLAAAERHGWMHRNRYVAVKIAVRRIALDAGLSRAATQDALAALCASGLVYRISQGNGPVPGSLALRVPDTDVPGTVVPPPPAPLTVPTSSVSGALYRLRHGPGRVGKAAAPVLEEVVDCPGGSRGELAERLGKKPDSLSRPLNKLVERGLVERRERGRYWPAEDWERALDRERTLTGEKLAERLDEQKYEREREAYRLRLAGKKEAEKARAASHEPRETDGPKAKVSESPEERIERLVHEGMARSWAEAEVLGRRRAGSVEEIEKSTKGETG